MRALAVVMLALVMAAGAHAQGVPKPGKARLAGLVTDPAISEISGIAASRQHPGMFWVHNDSGGDAEIHAIDAQAQRRARVEIAGARNFDWEDIALFRDGERDWLLIADTGDNGGVRSELQLYFVPEPSAITDGRAEVSRTLRFVWPDGARDCEAVAVDISERAIYLISKKRVPPEIYRLSLDADSSAAPVVAERVGLVEFVNQPSARDLQRNPVYGRYRAQITAMDISADGRRMVVLNYLSARIYLRGRGESWRDALARPPVQAAFPWLTQAEAVSFSSDARSLWIASEVLPAPLLQIPLDGR
jgi:hypothetical protein